MVTLILTRHGSPSPPRRRTRPRPSPVSPTVRRLAAALALVALALALPLGPARAATTTAPADPESLPIPEGSSAPGNLSGGAGDTLMRLGLGLVVVVGLIALVWYVLKRVQRSRYPGMERSGKPGGLIDVVSTTSIGPNRTLHVVRVGEEILLVGSTDHTITALTRLGSDDLVGLVDVPPTTSTFGRNPPPAGGPGVDDRVRAVTTSSDGALIEKLRSMTTRK
jgi:flagellar protein FliO/FliZ